MIGLAALIDHGLGLIGWIVVAATTVLSFFIQLAGILVSYIPYVAVMIKSPEAFDRYLWAPAYSPIIVQAKELLQHKYPYDLAYNTYPSEFLFHFQLIAMLLSLVVFGGGIYLLRGEKEIIKPEGNGSRHHTCKEEFHKNKSSARHLNE